MSSGYRHKSSEPYADFIKRERGTAGYPNLTVEIDSSYNQEFVDEFKRVLPHRFGRAKIGCDIAVKHFSHVYITEGEKITDIVSGSSWEQNGLFSEKEITND